MLVRCHAGCEQRDVIAALKKAALANDRVAVGFARTPAGIATRNTNRDNAC